MKPQEQRGQCPFPTRCAQIVGPLCHGTLKGIRYLGNSPPSALGLQFLKQTVCGSSKCLIIFTEEPCRMQSWSSLLSPSSVSPS